MASPKIIITGGNGFVGRHLVHELLNNYDYQIVVWDRSLERLPAEVTGKIIDITNPASFTQELEQQQPIWVIHLAALASIGASFTQGELTHRINVEGTRHLLEAVKQQSPATKILAVSTADIYGQGAASPLPELPLHRAIPKNPYAQSKWYMEELIEQSYLDCVIRVRPFPHIGPGQQRGFVTADFAAQIAALEAQASQGNPAVIKVGNLQAQRDFTDVRDVVRAYAMLLTDGKIGEVYHVASGKAVTIQDILDRLLALSKLPITVQIDPERMRPSDIPILVGDAHKLTAATSWQPTIPLEQSLQDILSDWRQRAAV